MYKRILVERWWRESWYQEDVLGEVCEIKESGELGFRKLTKFKLAMLAKQAWRLINNVNPLVTAIMKAKYYAHTHFLNAVVGTNPSYM